MFRDTSRNITARRVRSHGAISLSTIADPESFSDPKALSITTHHTGSSLSRSGTLPQSNFESPVKESRFAAWSPARTLRNARQSILPSYHSRNFSSNTGAPSRSSSTYSRFTSGEPKKNHKKKRTSSIPSVPLQISAPLNINPQFAHLVQQPDLAHHPSQRRPSDDVV